MEDREFRELEQAEAVGFLEDASRHARLASQALLIARALLGVHPLREKLDRLVGLLRSDAASLEEWSRRVKEE